MDRVGSAKEQFSKMEKGFEQSKVGAGIFSRISKTTSEGRTKSGLSVGRLPREVSGCRDNLGRYSMSGLVWVGVTEDDDEEGRVVRG